MKASRRCRAHTLLEVVFAIMLLALLLTVGFAGAGQLWKGEEIETSARKMQSVMMRALRMSVANQKEYAVILDPTQVRLIAVDGVLVAEDGGEVRSIAKETFVPGLEMYIRRWEEGGWRQVEFETLKFPVSGICEPVAFRLVNKGNVLEFALHPLTAFPTDEALVVE